MSYRTDNPTDPRGQLLPDGITGPNPHPAPGRPAKQYRETPDPGPQRQEAYQAPPPVAPYEPVTDELSGLQAIAKLLAQQLSLLQDMRRDIQNLTLFTLLENTAPTDLANTVVGSAIGTRSKYLEAFKNVKDTPVAVRVIASFTLAGQVAILSRTNVLSNSGRVDTLAQTGKLVSRWIYLNGRQILWINTGNTAFSMAFPTASQPDGAVFQVEVVDLESTKRSGS
jgi:hypothetical protein